MDKREKLAALAQKRRQEAEAASSKASQESSGVRKRPLSPHTEKNVNKSSKASGLQALRHSTSKKPSFIPRPSSRPLKKVGRKETPSPPRFGGDDDYDEGDGFVVGSEEESLEYSSEDSSLEEEVKEPVVSKKGNSKKSKKPKKGSRELSDEDVTDDSIAIEEEIEALDPSNIIDHGPGLRTRSARY